MTKYIPLHDYAKAMGVQKGDVVFISSDSKIMLMDAMMNRVPIDLNPFIDGLIEAVGEEGTILFPTYNWDFCSGKTFDYINTPCMTGSLGITALQRKDFIRTRHPIYSFAVYGRDKDYLLSMNNTDSFGLDSPFNYLKEKNTVNYVIDVSLMHSFTFVHFAEEHSGAVKHRYIKNFTAGYVDGNGKCETKTYSMFVRDLDMDVQTLIDPIEEDFVARGAARRFTVNHSSILRVELGKAYPILIDDIINNNSRKLCSFKGQN